MRRHELCVSCTGIGAWYSHTCLSISRSCTLSMMRPSNPSEWRFISVAPSSVMVDCPNRTPTNQSQDRFEINGCSCFLGHGSIARGFSHVQRGHLKDYAGNSSTTQDVLPPRRTMHLCKVATFPHPPPPFSFWYSWSQDQHPSVPWFQNLCRPVFPWGSLL